MFLAAKRSLLAGRTGPALGHSIPQITATPTLRPWIVRKRSRASRLPSVPSALRGLDPRHALPWSLATIGASAVCEVCYSLVSSARSKSDVSAALDALMLDPAVAHVDVAFVEVCEEGCDEL